MTIPHSKIYHFTCTALLPWIIDANELRPYRTQSKALASSGLLSPALFLTDYDGRSAHDEQC